MNHVLKYYNKLLIAAAALIFSCPAYAQEYHDTLSVKEKESRSVKDLINLVAYFQIEKHKSPIEGEYVRGTWQQVKDSKPPKTIYWDYATGVTFLAMQRVYDINSDKKILQFISDNNRISADQYAYLRWQNSSSALFIKKKGLINYGA